MTDDRSITVISDQPSASVIGHPSPVIVPKEPAEPRLRAGTMQA
jgi:hypothetical protein